MVTFEEVLTGLLRDGYSARFVARGDSMYPTIHSGDVLEVEPAPPSSLRVGDIVLTRATRGLTAHRIVRVTADGVITRGDNALRRDPFQPFSTVLGRAAGAFPPTRSPLAGMMLYCRLLARQVAGVFTRHLA